MQIAAKIVMDTRVATVESWNGKCVEWIDFFHDNLCVGRTCDTRLGKQINPMRNMEVLMVEPEVVHEAEIGTTTRFTQVNPYVLAFGCYLFLIWQLNRICVLFAVIERYRTSTQEDLCAGI